MRSLISLFAAALLGVLATPGRAQSDQPAVAGAWVAGHHNRARLVAGGWPLAESGVVYAAGIEIELDDGWKTYWRFPGTSGVPPNFTWDGSVNVGAIVVAMPAPVRFRDPDGDTIGYKSRLTFPVRITPADPAKPVALKLTLEFGVCKDICIPVQPELALTVPPSAATSSPGAAVKAALDRVPRAMDKRRPGDPEIKSRKAELKAAKPRLLVEAVYPAGATGTDLFIEAPDGLFVPLPTIKAGAGGAGTVLFAFDLSQGIEIADLVGREVRLTFVGSTGASETTWKLE